MKIGSIGGLSHKYLFVQDLAFYIFSIHLILGLISCPSLFVSKLDREITFFWSPHLERIASIITLLSSLSLLVFFYMWLERVICSQVGGILRALKLKRAIKWEIGQIVCTVADLAEQIESRDYKWVRWTAYPWRKLRRIWVSKVPGSLALVLCM